MQDLSTIRVIAHRGASGYAPENTAAAFVLAARQGARAIECDAKLTRDGRIVLIHDDTLDRTTSGRGRVKKFDLAAIQRLDAGGWFAPRFVGERILTLAEGLELWAEHRLFPQVEIKPCFGRAGETGTAVARAIARAWPRHLPRPVLSSFAQRSLLAARDAAPSLPRAYLSERVPADWHRILDRLGCAALHCNHKYLTAKKAKAVKDAGFALRCYTVNDPVRAREILDWGADAVFTDFPDRILAVL